MLTGDNGILTKASSAKEKTQKAQAEEEVRLAVLASIGTDGKIDPGDLKDNLNKIKGIETIREDIDGYIVKVNGYEFTISEDGNVQFAGGSYEEGGSSQTPTEVEITGIEATDITLEIGEKKELLIIKTPDNATEGVRYTSKNTDIATVDASGNVEGVAEGETIITIKSESEKVTTTCTVTVTHKIAVEEVTNHTAVELDSTIYTWEKIEQIAKVISDNDETITNDTSEVKVTIGETEYILGVGDTTTVSYNGTSKTVRIMGFNHDKLTSSTAYGGDNTYAGISFEFVNFIEQGIINNAQTNSGGWAECGARITLNNETAGCITKLSNEDYIKQVYKKYIETYNSASSVKTSADKLWLLSCSEIWDNGKYEGTSYGRAKAKEGNQYKYYKDIDAYAYSRYTELVKDSGSWWLRSPDYSESTHFCTVNGEGVSDALRVDGMFVSWGFAPGFSI